MVGRHCEFKTLGSCSPGEVLEPWANPRIVDQHVQLSFSLREIFYKLSHRCCGRQIKLKSDYFRFLLNFGVFFLCSTNMKF